MQSFPQPLSVEEENEAIERWEQGDREARNILIERNLRLVAYLVKKYSNSDHSVDDLISIGTIGLIKAVDTYRMGKGVRLATYASRCIDNELLMTFRSDKKRAREIFCMSRLAGMMVREMRFDFWMYWRVSTRIFRSGWKRKKILKSYTVILRKI